METLSDNTADKAAGTKKHREAFSISRSMEYMSENELTKQIGHPRHLWHLAIVKELIDNALDHTEEIGVLPEITVTVDDEGIAIQDNGAGLSPEIVVGMLDFEKRISSREAYRSTTRGAQGNAAKCLIGVPYVWNGDKTGRVTIKAQGVRHDITVELDRLAQAPKIKHVQTDEKVQNGTFIKVYLRQLPSILDRDNKLSFVLFAQEYAALNPHLTLSLEAFGGSCSWDRTVSECKKWTAAEPDPPRWYDIEGFERLVGACIAKDRDTDADRSVRDFLRGFAGLSRSAKLKAVTDDSGLSRCNLSILVNCNGLDRNKTTRLLEAMQEHGREPKPAKLGRIGREHIESSVFASLNVVSETIMYKTESGTMIGGLPFVVEAAFAELSASESESRIITGCNFSPAVDRPCVRTLDTILEHQMIEDDSPVVVMLHIVTPAPKYLDRGKSVIDATGELNEAIKKCVVNVTSEWRKQKKLEERNAAAAARNRLKRLRQPQRRKTPLNEAIFAMLDDAIENASGGYVVDFSQRDLYYATRSLIQQLTDEELTQKYFDKVTDDWEKERGLIEGRLKDPRGFLVEPHTGTKIPLGTKAVDEYEVPLYQYDTILYFEKKGMESKCAWGQIPERFDCAIMACEGYAVRAAKALLQAAQHGRKMKVLCFHDADPAGYNIFRTLTRKTGAHSFDVEVIDAGLHLQEAIDMKLAVETFTRKKSLPRGLQLTPFEKEYFAGEQVNTKLWRNCKRVELNALSADPHRFVEWVESKLEEHGCARKLVPPKLVIEKHAHTRRDVALKCAIDAAIDEHIEREDIISRVCKTIEGRVEIKSIPPQLERWAEDVLPRHWTDCVTEIVEDGVAALDAAIRAEVAATLRIKDK